MSATQDAQTATCLRYPECNDLLPGFGNRVHQPNLNFAPQLGIAWDPKKDPKTVIRAGIGMFYENAIWNNAEFDRPERLANGAFLANPSACFNGAGVECRFLPADNAISRRQLECRELYLLLADWRQRIGAECGQLQQGSPQLFAWRIFKTPTKPPPPRSVANAPNPNYIPNLISSGSAIPLGALAPNYRTPYSIQMNAGIQRQLLPGMVLSVDYLRNVNLHYSDWS